MIAVFPPAELSSLLKKRKKILMGSESEDAVNPEWCKTAVKFHKLKYVDDRLDPTIL